MVDLISWDPYREFRSLQERFNRAFGITSARREREEELGAWIPPVDIAEDKDKIVLTAELPGFKEDQIQIQMEGGVLTLRGERRFEKEKKDDGRSYHRIERSYGQFMRSFTLPNNVDRENIQAKFSDGVLEIELPKREETKPRQIRITGASQERKKEPIDVKTK